MFFQKHLLYPGSEKHYVSQKTEFPWKISDFLEKAKCSAIGNNHAVAMQKNPKTFYSLKKKYNSQQVLHGFEHDFKGYLAISDRCQTRITADVSIPNTMCHSALNVKVNAKVRPGRVSQCDFPRKYMHSLILFFRS